VRKKIAQACWKCLAEPFVVRKYTGSFDDGRRFASPTLLLCSGWQR